jgi:hypothetical protein
MYFSECVWLYCGFAISQKIVSIRMRFDQREPIQRHLFVIPSFRLIQKLNDHAGEQSPSPVCEGESVCNFRADADGGGHDSAKQICSPVSISSAICPLRHSVRDKSDPLGTDTSSNQQPAIWWCRVRVPILGEGSGTVSKNTVGGRDADRI